MALRILYLAHRIPYPPNKGDKIRSYHHVRHLAARHEVHLFTFVDEPGDEAGADALRRHCARVVALPLNKRMASLRGAWSLATGRSLSAGYFGLPAMRRAIARAGAQQPFDVAWAYSSVMGQYLRLARAGCCVADFVDVDSEKWRQYGQRSRGPWRWLFALEAGRVRALERAVGSAVQHVLFVARAEADLFRALAPGVAPCVIPNGVDVEYFSPNGHGEEREHALLLFTGALDYRPNVDAVRFAVREVLPRIRHRIPTARLLAVGHRPAAELQRIAEAHPDLFAVAGSVPDVRPYFRRAHVYLAALELGRGVQNKVLEAMAMRVPVVATPLAVAGLDIEPGRHALVGRNADELAAAVLRVMEDASCGRALVDDAAQLIRERYTWPGNLRLLDGCLTPRGAPAAAHGPGSLHDGCNAIRAAGAHDRK